MGKRQPSPKRLTPDPARLMACVFRTPWGWMGMSETTKGINAVVLPKASRQVVLAELGFSSAELPEGRISPRLREAQAQLTGYLAGMRRSFGMFAGPFTRDKFSTEGLATLRRISYGQLRSYQWVAVRVEADGMPVPWVMPWGRIRYRL